MANKYRDKLTLGDMRAEQTQMARIWRYVDAHQKVTIDEIVVGLGIGRQVIGLALRRLRERGWIDRESVERAGRYGRPSMRYWTTVPEAARSTETREETIQRMAREGHSVEAIAKQVGIRLRHCLRTLTDLGISSSAQRSVARTAKISTKNVDGMLERLDMALEAALPSEDQVAMLLGARPQRKSVDRLLATTSQIRKALRRIEKLLTEYQSENQRGSDDDQEDRAHDARSPSQL